MITLILGKKGSGKTKRLIDMCNAATAESKGNVVFIEKDSTLTYERVWLLPMNMGSGASTVSMALSPACAQATTTSPTFLWIPR